MDPQTTVEPAETPEAPMQDHPAAETPVGAVEATDQGQTGEPGERAGGPDHPGDGHGAAAAPAAAEHTGATASNAWGRIEADGTAVLLTADGERVVGSWQAGDAAAGLAFFERQFADLEAQVRLLEQRLSQGLVKPGDAERKVGELRQAILDAKVIGDLATLSARLDTVEQVVAFAKESRDRDRAAARDAAVERKTALVVEAEGLSGSTAWKAAGDRIRAILEEMKAIRGLDKATEQSLWQRYQAARDEFSRRRGTHFASLDEARKVATGAKEALIAEAESLATSTDWKATASRLKAMMAEWKTLPRASKETEDALWTRFRAAQDQFFHRRSETFAARDEEYREHLRAKEELLAEAEAVDPADDLERAKALVRDLKHRWDDIGRVPREAMLDLDARLRALDDRLRRAQDAAWQRGRAAANPLAEQFRAQIARLEEQASKARAAGRAAEAEKHEAAAAAWKQSLDNAESGKR